MATQQSGSVEPAFSGIQSSAQNLSDQLKIVLGLISSRYPFIDRVAVALYDPATDLIKTFVSSNRDGSALQCYEVPLAEVPSLAEMARSRQRRLVGEIDQTFLAQSEHTLWLKAQNYHSSYTTPIFQGEELAAFLFFDSHQPHAFSEEVAVFLDSFSDLIAQLFLMQQRLAHGMASTIQLAVDLARVRDFETGQHLERIAYFSRIMARALAKKKGLTDEYIEYLQLFAPLHDIGKVGIPDHVLLKPGRLDEQEYEVMKRHVTIGENIIDRIGRDMGLQTSLPNRIMRNIVATHHERGDGSGYPRGLTMDQIPLEGRIVAVADVYDALTNRRAYKAPWSEAEVEAEMQRQALIGQLDGECVEALMAAREARAAIKLRFADDHGPS
ncbi:MAG: HD domain-containing protein [Rhodoferax sp.]|nr:HD domain-containing protein [Rhodoferax sp.]